MMPITEDGVLLLAREWQEKLTRYLNVVADNYYWTGVLPKPAHITDEEALIQWYSDEHLREVERRGREAHRLHVEAYEAGEIFRGGLRQLARAASGQERADG